MSQRDRTQDLEQILRVCDCGWSQVATYPDLKSHQADKGCTPRSKVNEQNLSENVGLTNNQGDLLFGVPTLWDESSSAMSERDPTQGLNLAFGVRDRSMVSSYPDWNSHQASMGFTLRSVNQGDQQNLFGNVGVTNNQEDLWPNFPNLGAGMSQRDPTQDLSLTLGVGDWSMVSTNPDLNSHQADMGGTEVNQSDQQNLSENVGVTNNQEDLRLNVANLGADEFCQLPNIRDPTQDSELILRVCYCGWSKVAKYSDLKSHQTDKGCTPRLKVNQQNLSENVGYTNNQGDLQIRRNVPKLGADMSQRDRTQDSELIPRVCGCGWSKIATYSDLKSHQADMGCRPKSKVKLQNLSENVGFTNNHEELRRNAANLGADMSQRDRTQDSELIPRVCGCGWSKIATYSDLKSHQVDMGCRPKSKVKLQNLSENVGFTNNHEELRRNAANLGADMSQRDRTQDSELIPRVCGCGWSKIATYSDLKSHQVDMGCRPKSKVKLQNLSENVGFTNNHEELRRNAANLGAADMASAHAPPSETLSLEQQLTCPICMNLFDDPVTTACGHTFCKGCLDFNCQSNDRLCPLCKQIVRRTPVVNIVMRSIAEQVKKTQQEVQLSLAPGEVACDICTEPKLKAEKSCLVCLASYCSTHLENHSSTKRLKGHKLVEPVENLDERACLEHGRPLELYSRKTEKCICARCLEEGQEEVVSTEDEWQKKKTKLENTKKDLQEKIKKRKKRMVEIDESLKGCKDQLDTEWWDIDAVFTTLINIAEEAHASALKPLTERREVLEKDAKDIKDELEAEIDRLEKTISELDDISALEDHILFLQRYPSLRDPDNHKDSTTLQLDTSLSFGTMRKTTTAMMERIQLELETLASTEFQRIQKFTVDVKLDPTTAHRRLVLSDDGKEVKDGGDDQEVDDSPERFDLFASILGINRLTTGKSYWEVEVSNKMGWDLGVTTGDSNRKGKLTLNPDNGYWVTVHYEDEKYAALTAPPVGLSLKKKPQKVGVFVDYEEGLVSFYDVRAQSHIFSFTNCSFGDDLFPYFSPHARKDEDNSDPLIISAVKHVG